MAVIVAGILASYLIGAFPTAYLAGRLLKGIDIRKEGSGNVGATNALRVLGKGPGSIVLLIDILKAVAATVLISDLCIVYIPTLMIPMPLLRFLCGISAVAGHNWPVFLKFRGGKGIASTLGVLIGLSLRVPGLGAVMGLSLLTWVVMFLLLRIVSLSSLIAALTLPLYLFIFKFSFPWIFGGSVLTAIIIFQHRANIKRLLRKEEKRIF